MQYPRTIVALFHDSNAAQVGIEHLLGAGFAPHDIKMADQNTLRGRQHPDATEPHDTSHESLREGLVRFFKEVFTSHDDAADHYADAAHPHSAIVTVQVASAERATQARTLLDTYGAAGVFRQSAELRESIANGTLRLGQDLARLAEPEAPTAN